MGGDGSTTLSTVCVWAILSASFGWSISVSAEGSALPKYLDFRAESNRRYPLGQAERMIKALNLLPGVSEAAFGDLSDEDDDNGPRLVEKQLKLTIKGESGSSITTDDLGQNAGYFKLAWTHASRMFYFFFESQNNKSTDLLVLW